MTRFLYNLLGTLCVICATVTLMTIVLRFDYGILGDSAARWPLWKDVVCVIAPTVGAALFFTSASAVRPK